MHTQIVRAVDYDPTVKSYGAWEEGDVPFHKLLESMSRQMDSRNILTSQVLEVKVTQRPEEVNSYDPLAQRAFSAWKVKYKVALPNAS